MRLSLLPKLFLLTIPAVVLSLILVGASMVWTSQKKLKESVITRELEVAEKIATKTADFMSEMEGNLMLTSRTPAFRGNDLELQRSLLEYLLFRSDTFNQLTLIGHDGNEIIKVSKTKSVFEQSTLKNRLTSEVFKNGINGKVYTGNPYIASDESLLIDMGVPVEYYKGKISGVIEAQINLKSIANVIFATRIGEEGFVYIVSGDGTIIIHPQIDKALRGENIRQFPLFKEITTNHSSSLEYVDEKKETILAVAKSIPVLEWIVIVQQPTREAYALLHSIYVQFSIAILLSASLLAFFIAIFVKRLLSPLNMLKQGAEIIGAGNLLYTIEIKSEDEIGQLTKVFNDMASKLHQSYENLEHKVQERTQDLAKERDFSHAIISSMGEALVVVDKDTHVLFVNDVVESLLGMKFADILNKKWTQVSTLLQGDTEIPVEENPVVKTISGGKTLAYNLSDNLYYKTVTGKKLPVSLIVTPLQKNGVNGAVLTFQNITEIKKLDESKSGFISIASHQLRTPLTSMRWFIEMLLRGEAGQFSDQQHHFIEGIYQDVGRMVELVNLLLQIARVETGRLNVEPKLLGLKKITQDVILTLGTMLNNKFQKIEITCDPDPLPLILMDKGIIWQIIQNLITNANRYSPEKSLIRVGIKTKGDFIEYSIKDTGIGIPHDQQERIFEKFFRAENALKSVPGGSGLGLSLVKALVEGWNGKTWFESEEGKGTTFFFTIPVEGIKPKKGSVGLEV